MPRRGSPPRVRGKHMPPDFRPSCIRITPACAGKTNKKNPGFRQNPDHPRVCGENDRERILCEPHIGSPPRVRGKHNCRDLLFLRPRITPACAGKTLAAHHIDCIHPDHPRVCGENLKSCKVPFVVHGSPPRVRGKLQFLSECHVLLRITPACAGKTSV